MLLSRPAIEDAIRIVGPTDFYKPKHASIYQSIVNVYESGSPVDWVTVSDNLNERGLLEEIGDPAFFVELQANTPSTSNASNYAHIIAEDRASRELIRICNEIKERAYSLENPYELSDEIQQSVNDIHVSSDEPESITIWELSERVGAEPPWIIEGILKKDWRAIITGAEGTGKGVLMRCMALATAYGVHPFTHQPAEPKRTLLVDAENPSAAVLETGLVLANTLTQYNMKHARDIPDNNFGIWHRPRGINLRKRRDRSDFIREVLYQKPELVCIGPWYKIQRSKPKEDWDTAALEALDILDDLRSKYGFALVIEAHSAKGGGDDRSLMPKGSSYLAAWPELGWGLKEQDGNDVLDVIDWRGARMKNQWPVHIVRDPRYVIGGHWNPDQGMVTF